MDIMNYDEGGMWFQSSGSWDEDREVSYFGQSRLVPLLRAEVPFEYAPGLVFLWDRNYGVAVASRLVDAWMPDYAVPHERSRAALIDKPVFDEGFCYLNATAGQVVNGPHPTAGELIASGKLDDTATVSYEPVASGRYHCVPGDGGLSLDKLDCDVVVGSATVAACYGGAGCLEGVTCDLSQQWAFDRNCVVGASTVDFCTAKELGVAGLGNVRAAGIRWFGHRKLYEDLYLNMGMIWLSGPLGVGVTYETDDPMGLTKIYWFDAGGLRVVCSQAGPFRFVAPEGLAVLYVFGVTDKPLVGTVYHPIKCRGCVSRHCSCADCFPGASACASPLVTRGCPCRATSLLDLTDRVLPGAASDYGATWLGPGVWHVGRRGQYSFEEVLNLVRAAVRNGEVAFKIGSDSASVHDLVGAASGIAVVLHDRIPALASVDPGELDALGASLAGLPPGILGAPEKARLKVLQTIGDNLLSLHLSLLACSEGTTAQDYQERRSRYTCNPYLRDLFVGSPFALAFAGGVGDISPKTGGGALEAVVAVAFRAGGVLAVDQLLELIGFGTDETV